MDTTTPSRIRGAVIWACTLAAFSPVLVELAGFLLANPWARYAGVFALLFARAASLEREPSPVRRDGLLWIACGLLIEIAGAFSGAIRIGRVGLVLAGVGAARRFGLASSRSLVLWVLAIPTPTAAVKFAVALLPVDILSLVLKAYASFGIPLAIQRGPFEMAGAAFTIDAFDTGVALMPLLAGLSWYRSLRLERATREACARAAAASLLAFPAQALFLGLALGVSVSLEPALGRQLLSQLPWIAISAISIFRTERLGASPTALTTPT